MVGLYVGILLGIVARGAFGYMPTDVQWWAIVGFGMGIYIICLASDNWIKGK